MIAPAPLLFCRLAAVALATALSISTAEAQLRGGGARHGRWVAWWRLAWRGLAWRWWLGLAWWRKVWWRLGLVAWVGLGLSHTTADLCASTSLLLPAASLLPWSRILSATACLLCSAISLRIRPRLPQLWRFSVLQRRVSRVWHVDVDDVVPQQLRHT